MVVWGENVIIQDPLMTHHVKQYTNGSMNPQKHSLVCLNSRMITKYSFGHMIALQGAIILSMEDLSFIYASFVLPNFCEAKKDKKETIPE